MSTALQLRRSSTNGRSTDDALCQSNSLREIHRLVKTRLRLPVLARPKASDRALKDSVSETRRHRPQALLSWTRSALDLENPIDANLRNVGVHVLRHTFCSHLAMKGAGARAIQELAGHRDLSTTQRYMRVSPAAVESAIRLLDAEPFRLARGADGETASTAP
jgi:integrase